MADLSADPRLPQRVPVTRGDLRGVLLTFYKTP